MKRLMIATVAVFVLFNLSLAYAQHGKGVGNSGAGVSHKPMSPGKSATSHSAGAKLTPSQTLAGKPKLTNTLKGLLPDTTHMTTLCDGFKNLGQCVAAVHVSHNLGMTFTELKTTMLGTPAAGDTPAVAPMSLGKAIQTINPKADATVEVNKANKQAKDDLQG